METECSEGGPACKHGGALGEIDAGRLDALRHVLGESRFNHLSSSQTETELWLRGADEGSEVLRALKEAGFDAERLGTSYVIVRDLGGQSCALIIEDDDEHERVVKRMLEAGVSVEHRTTSGP